jgi:hypothetical protein
LVAYIEDFATNRDIRQDHIDRMRRFNAWQRHPHSDGRELPRGESKTFTRIDISKRVALARQRESFAPSSRFSKPYPRNWVAGKPGGLYALPRETSCLRP